MESHDYSPRGALDLLLRKLREKSSTLAEEVEWAINSGKEIANVERIGNQGRKERQYRKIVPFTVEEALQVALDVLEAHFVEYPSVVNRVEEQFQKAGIGEVVKPKLLFDYREKPAEKIAIGAIDQNKAIELEILTETQVSREGQETFKLDWVSSRLIDQQKRNIERLEELTKFGKKRDG